MNNEWAVEQLELFVEMTQSRNGSRNGFITTQSFAVTPRDDVMAQQAVVVRILDSHTPQWRDDYPIHPSYEFGQVRDAAMAACAVLRREDEIAEHLDPPGPSLSSDAFHPWIWEPARPYWRSPHFRVAVREATTGLDLRLKDLVGRRDVSGTALVNECFGSADPAPGKPRLRVPDQGDDDTTKSVQEGLLALGRSCFLLVRNPATHRTEDLTEQEALEQLAMLSLFARTVETCTVVHHSRG